MTSGEGTVAAVPNPEGIAVSPDGETVWIAHSAHGDGVSSPQKTVTSVPGAASSASTVPSGRRRSTATCVQRVRRLVQGRYIGKAKASSRAVIGLVAAIAVTGVLSGGLFGVSSADPIGLCGAAALVLGVALAAGVLAARPVLPQVGSTARNDRAVL
jgi:hypothetical protein